MPNIENMPSEFTLFVNFKIVKIAVNFGIYFKIATFA